jgi:hypothetical protein
MVAHSQDDKIPFRFLGGKGTFNAGASVWVYLLCLFLGLPFAFVFLIRAPYEWLRARSWVETPCNIISSEMKLEDGNPPRYRAHVVYEYRFADQNYRSSQINILRYFRVRPRYREPAEDDLRAL